MLLHDEDFYKQESASPLPMRNSLMKKTLEPLETNSACIIGRYKAEAMYSASIAAYPHPYPHPYPNLNPGPGMTQSRRLPVKPRLLDYPSVPNSRPNEEIKMALGR
jgi:hypothetical protein